jgi:hypothetical protein
MARFGPAYGRNAGDIGVKNCYPAMKPGAAIAKPADRLPGNRRTAK